MDFWKVVFLIGAGVVGYKIYQHYSEINKKRSTDSCSGDTAEHDDASETTDKNQAEQPDAQPVNA